ncbi:adenylate kinase [Zhouia amylolytica]|uniref:Adenylate kinase n=1 Tax=Zhouia amylolytica TaxID=376730 RepID=A0A1I6TXM0_9FLAO|nr:adenylate kinase [Zhouia amylolytica]MCQ0111060.1 adenylate kinase [Zhouia amylolytica]SFS93942.1 adenylate kinase [Zhouia amylolytica]
MIKLHDKYFVPYVTATELDEVVSELARNLKRDMEGEVPVFLSVLNGSFMFTSDFVKKYDGDCEVSFIKLASYCGTESTGTVKELVGVNQSLKGRSVVVLEDIIDSGNTLEVIYDLLKKEKVKDLKIVTLFFKPVAFTKKLKIDYIGKEIPNRFIVGYGLDYDELGRNLPEVYQLKRKKMINLVLFGKPGAGKGTQANFLKEKYSLKHISTGDVFRFNIKNETELGKLAKTYIDNGELVPDEVTINMLKAEVEKNLDAAGFIFDGFPRTTAQAKALDELMQYEGMQVDATIALEADDEVLIQRLLERGKVSGRSDDQDEEKIRNRFTEYNEKTAPLTEYYKKQNKFHSINGVGTIEDITERLSKVIDSLVAVNTMKDK